MFTVDHIAVAANTLEEGAAYVEDTLGVAMAPGGEHPLMGTHNRLLGLADGLYLEVIAINPAAPAPAHPRWFDLDHFTGQPRITNWILRCDDLADALQNAPVGSGDPFALSRGDLRWKMAVPETGILPLDNIAPALIAWEGDAHPADRLPPSGCKLTGLTVRHPQADRISQYFAAVTAGPASLDLTFETGAPGFEARFDTPSGIRVLK